jgi:hypothetical protein
MCLDFFDAIVRVTATQYSEKTYVTTDRRKLAIRLT